MNTPGGQELWKRMGGAGGPPFFAFLDSDGKEIVNSNRPEKDGKTENIGHPMEPEEVDWFLVMVHKAVPQITREESDTLEHYLRNQKK
ncbi:MAG TPA: hypothetical protein VMB03_20205 [Bryobacteraceae bacterium]|nr:hypothetical protein [Bryobacteraceae bacterium]